MKSASPGPELDTAPLSEQAAHWWVVLHEDTCTAADREAFAAWVYRSPERIEAYLRVDMLMGALHTKKPSWPDTPADELIRQARTSTAEVIPLSRTHRASRVRAHGPFSFLGARMWMYASLAVVCCAVLVAWFVVSPARFETELGEQRSVVLDDGSLITLNTSSQIEVKYTDAQRFIRLVRGEALFNVAHDPSRPFDVDTGQAVVRAVGTQFNVDRRAHRTTVTVVEGRVQVTAEPVRNSGRASTGSAPAVQPETEMLAAAQRLVLNESGMGEPEPIANIAPVIAWTQRQLVFEDQPLSEVAAEFNRYNRQHILIQAPALDEQRVTGVFQANDPTSFLGFLARIPGVRIATTAQGDRIVTLPGGNEKNDAGQGPKP